MSRSLLYGLGLLRLFTAEHPVRTISELADLLGVSRPTAHRYATTYLELGYLEQAPMRRYRLTRRGAQLGSAMIESLPLARAARPVVRELRDGSGHTASLAVLDGADVVYLLRLRGLRRGQYELERGLGSGSRLPARHTPAGLALLAAQARGEAAGGDAGGAGGCDVEGHSFMTGSGAWGLAVAVRRRGEGLSALELTVPGDVAADAQAVSMLSARLRAAAEALGVATSGAACCAAPARARHARSLLAVA